MKNFKRFFLGMLIIAGIVGMIVSCNHSKEPGFQGRVWKQTEMPEGIFFWDKGTDDLYHGPKTPYDKLSAKNEIEILKVSGNTAEIIFRNMQIKLIEVSNPTPQEIKSNFNK